MKTVSHEAEIGEVKKVVLLYSGGLDTSCMVKWIQENYNADVIALFIDVGQAATDTEEIKKKALSLGAVKAYVIDAKDEFAEGYIAKAIKANALYQGKYPLVSSLSRPLLSKKAVEIAEKEGADAIAHGCTGKGNDQVRIEVSASALDPDIKIIAPVRDWKMTRDEELEYAKKRGIPIPEINKTYSTDENLWGKSYECGVLEHPQEEPPKDIYNLITYPEDAPDIPEYVTLKFESGIPVDLNGANMKLSELIQALSKIAGDNGVGIIDHMEDRIVGLKSREVYECPAAVCVIEAHKDLEKYVSTIHENSFKQSIDQKWAELTYYGLWHDPLMDSLNCFIDKMNEKVSGWVKLKLYKGNLQIVGRSSPYALYDLNLATYNSGHVFNQAASPGFIELWGLQTKTANKIKNDQALAKGIRAKQGN